MFKLMDKKIITILNPIFLVVLIHLSTYVEQFCYILLVNSCLTLKAPITTAADDFVTAFLIFEKNKE